MDSRSGQQDARPSHHHPLDRLPDGAELWSVTATPGQLAGRDGLRVSLAENIARDGTPDVDYIDQPTMVLLPVEFRTGTIRVSVLGQLTATAPDYARGFIGLAYHVDPRTRRFESVYLRPLNGTATGVGLPRSNRGVQYFAYPDWRFDRLRDDYPDGRYEAAAPIEPGHWHDLTLAVTADAVTAEVDGVPILNVTEPKAQLSSGRIGLFVDIGTDGWFADLRADPID